MEYTARQKRILSEMKDRDILQDGRDDQARDRTTDAERTKIAYDVLKEVEYDPFEHELELAKYLVEEYE